MSDAYMPTVTYQYQSPYGKVSVTARHGVTNAMLDESLRHFRHAQEVLARGSRECSSKVPKERDMPEGADVTSPLISIWGDALLKPDDNHSFKILLNVCTEYVSAWHLVDLAWLLFDTVIEPQLSAETPAQPAPFGEPIVTANKALERPANGVTHHGTKPKDFAYDQCSGSVFSFDIVKIGAAMDKKGVLVYELYCAYKGQPGQWPDFRVYSDSDGMKIVGDTLTELNLQAGQDTSKSFIYTTRVAVSKGKVYFNPVSLQVAF